MATSDEEGVALRFAHDGRTVELPAEQIGTRSSPFTGRELRELRTEATLRADEAATLHDVLASPIVDENGVEWDGCVAQESFTDGGPHRLVVEWTEREPELVAETVEFEGFSLAPSDYEEEEQEGVVAVTFRATLTEAEMRRLWALRRERGDAGRLFWPVVRRGVTDTPRTMRLGRILWEQQGDRYEHLITLVDETKDRAGPWVGMRGEPELSHAIAGLADLAGQFDELLEVLHEAGTLDEQARDRIREAGREARRQREYTFYEVDDLSHWQ